MTIDQEGVRQVFLAHYMRHHAHYVEECESPDDAQGFLRRGEDDGALSSCCVIWPDGRRRTYDYAEDDITDEWLPPHSDEVRRECAD